VRIGKNNPEINQILNGIKLLNSWIYDWYFYFKW